MITSTGVVLLDVDFNFIEIIHWKKAIKLVIKQKAETIKESDIKIGSIVLPKILKLFRSFSYLAGKKMRWSKHNVFERDSWVCGYCSKPLSKHNATLDHIVPVSKGGKNSWENTVCSCQKCNSIKNDKFLHETGMVLKTKLYAPTVYEHFRNKLKNSGFDIKDLM